MVYRVIRLSLSRLPLLAAIALLLRSLSILARIQLLVILRRRGCSWVGIARLRSMCCHTLLTVAIAFLVVMLLGWIIPSSQVLLALVVPLLLIRLILWVAACRVILPSLCHSPPQAAIPEMPLSLSISAQIQLLLTMLRRGCS